ncbi:MAG: methyltransferase domain-containing protein [Candidatus Lokiarchaeota archaeon]|nr:methyltransferase domain-containing protein [Candidatus Lokiarchaeota archaeon]
MYFDYKEAVDYIAEIYKEADKPTVQEITDLSGNIDFDPVIEDEIARLFRVLLKSVKPKRVLEIGLSIGFSTVHIAKAIKSFGGNLITLEIDEEIAKVAKKNLEHFEVADIVEMRFGDAQELIKEFKSESFDVVFQDSSKRLYPVMFEECLRVLRKGGLFLIDDTLFPVMTAEDDWSASDKAIHRFNQLVADGKLESTILPIGEGCTVAVKL